MDNKINKKNIIINTAFSLLGLIIGSIITTLFLPADCPVCNDCIEVGGETDNVQGSTDRIVLEDVDITKDSDVPLPVSECSLTVDIAGAVEDPGVYCFKEGSKLVDVVKRASGFSDGVAYRYVAMKVNLSELITNHQKIYIPFEEDVYCEVKSLQYIDTQQNTSQQLNNVDNQSDSAQSCININTATKDQLTTLDGVGESTAQKIIDARPFTVIEDILNVSGIGESTYTKLKDEICVY